MSKYPVKFEIEGPAAMFTRPDTGAAPISYPVPTWSACKAMFESVARGFFADNEPPRAFFCPTEVEIWRPIRFEKYTTNYRGPLRKAAQIKKEASYQLPATILVDACFRIKGECMPTRGISGRQVNAAHALQEMFYRRIKKGLSKYMPCLGWKEFMPSYFGPFRDHAGMPNPPEKQIAMDDIALPGFLLSMWDAPTNGRYRPTFCEGLIKGGSLKYPAVIMENGKIRFVRGETC
jgi:CRISPR-associated protein Cas5d